jgi:hypothetical protein
VLQASPATHATQAPALQTWFAPHDVPFGKAAALMHCCVPVEQSWTPTWQRASGCVVQASPATQVTHEPPLHT